MSTHNLQSKPPKPLSRPELEDIRKKFIVGDESQEKSKDHVKKHLFPWEAPYVRTDVKKLFSLRFSEPEMLKLKFIHEKTGKSMHQFCMEAIMPKIEAEIERLAGELSE